jgi:hypothetical protein
MNTQTKEALEKIERRLRADNLDEWSLRALADIAKEALEAEQVCQAQKPFGIYHVGDTEEESDFFLFKDSGDVSCEKCIKLYTHHHQDGTSPSKARDKEFVTLTDDEIDKIWNSIEKYSDGSYDDFDFARAIEQELKDKNT